MVRAAVRPHSPPAPGLFSLNGPRKLAAGNPRGSQPPPPALDQRPVELRSAAAAPSPTPAAPYLPPAEKKGAGGRRQAARSPQPAPPHRETEGPDGPQHHCRPAAIAAQPPRGTTALPAWGETLPVSDRLHPSRGGAGQAGRQPS